MLVDKLAAGLRARGGKRGDSAMLVLRNRPEFLLLHAALSRMGCAAVSVSWRSTPDELAYLLNHSGSKFVFFDFDLGDKISGALSKVTHLTTKSGFAVGGESAPFDAFETLFDTIHTPAFQDESEEAAVVIYTSGTTGKPKGAVRKFPREAITQGMKIIELANLRSDDVHLAVCPLYHATAFGFANFSLLLGAPVVLLEEFKPELFLQAIEKYRVTVTAMVPTMLHRVVELGPEVLKKYDLSSLKGIFVGGAPLPGPLATQVLDTFGDVLYNFYGATETGIVTLATPQDLRNCPTTIGRAVPGNDIRILDENGKIMPWGRVGELYVKNTMLVEGYHRDEKATQDSMREGYFSVGDLARMDSAGRFFIEGRKRDMIISGGVNVYPAEVEGVLEMHPEILEVAVVGVADLEWGEKVRAVVVLREGVEPNPEGLKAYCRQKLSGPKVPREFLFLDTLPRNPTGKVLKRELRNL